MWGAPSFGSDGANLNGANSAYFTVDLGKEYEFSAVRLFGRFAMWGQAMEMGSLCISPDGKVWSKAFAHADTAGQSQKYTTADKSLFTVEYKSTGDIYTDMKANDKNLKARYIRVEATKTPWGQWHMQELMLVKPDESKDTLTAEEATAFYAEEAEKVLARPELFKRLFKADGLIRGMQFADHPPHLFFTNIPIQLYIISRIVKLVKFFYSDKEKLSL